MAGLIVPSECGSEFRPLKFQQALKHHRVIESTGPAGASRANAAMESFFTNLQKNVLTADA
ncbi:hypothetical protein [Micrococcus terreus]|uniref:Integrase core domain-containing protein n=1 Tax=Micrococcus terreus TaxID=574650 RepID=A0A1I7ME21_9MICC|nr:hypothetical protein [Micrococcus terreus]SFV20184.1 hypothetical protein SAMN04487966_101201 [Micrococcus terreus]